MVGISLLSFTIHTTYTASFMLEYPKTSNIVKCLQPDFYSPCILSAIGLPQTTFDVLHSSFGREAEGTWGAAAFLSLLARREKAMAEGPNKGCCFSLESVCPMLCAVSLRACMVLSGCGGRLLWGNGCSRNVPRSPLRTQP